MMLCRYVVIATNDTGEHAMKCVRCSGVNSSRHSPDKVHTICVQPPTVSEIRSDVRYDLGTGIDDDDWPTVSERVTACCGCSKFSGYGCAELGKRCRTGRIRWLERLVMGECEGWATS